MGEVTIFGVGDSFSNSFSDNKPSFQILLKGYNYEKLEAIAMQVSNRLKINKRIQNINTNSDFGLGENKAEELILKLYKPSVAILNFNESEVLSNLSSLTEPTNASTTISFGGKMLPVILKEQHSNSFSNYELFNSNLRTDGLGIVRLRGVADLQYNNIESTVYKENREYIKIVGLEYIGQEKIGKAFLDTAIVDINASLPLGFVCQMYSDKMQKQDYSIYLKLLILIVFLIYVICAILFEDLWQPLCVIALIPISFIGIFLIFILSDSFFDQGGYAAFLMSSGFVTMSALFLINDFNTNKKNLENHFEALKKALAYRLKTIVITTISACCGLIPFLSEGQNEVFWFSFSMGTLGGLIFSLLGLFFILPLLLTSNKLKEKLSNIV